MVACTALSSRLLSRMRMSEGIKSKVDELKAAYDREESPNLEDYEPNTVASLLKQYLRDLPENLLTKELLPRFEEACVRATESEKVQEFQRLLRELPSCNSLLLSWLVVHMDHVIAQELETKMNVQNISIVLSPTVQVLPSASPALLGDQGVF